MKEQYGNSLVMKQSFRNFLQNEFILRCRKNNRYSLRAFAKFLNVDHSTLSQIMRGKRNLTKSTIIKFSSSFSLSNDQVQEFVDSLASGEDKTRHFEQLSVDTYAVISDWYHYAIFELLTVKHFKQNISWIAKTLQITESEAQSAVDRLMRVDLIQVDAKGNWKPSTPNVTTINNEFTAEAFRTLQKGLLQKALFALENVPFEKRDHSSITMAIHSKRIPEAKARIKKFRRDLCDWIQKDSQRDSVYELVVAFFPVTDLND